MIFWVATHRRHHRFSDKEGDPHSPQLGRSLLGRFWHAHIGWMFSEMPSNPIKEVTALQESLAKEAGEEIAQSIVESIAAASNDNDDSKRKNPAHESSRYCYVRQTFCNLLLKGFSDLRTPKAT
jgi:hypothetical protein